MSGSGSSSSIINGVDFNPLTDYTYTKPKVNSSGGKSIGVINPKSMKGLYISTPLMLTWGVNENTDEKTGTKSYDMAIQFPKDDYTNDNIQAFFENIKAFENKIKEDAITNSKEWFNKQKMSTEVVDALWTPMLKYPKDQETKEFDYSRPPTLRIKLNTWDGTFKCELYDLEQQQIFPNENGLLPPELIVKATNVATVIQCGGLWFASGKFGVTWRLIQAVVKPKETMQGKCLIQLSKAEKEVLQNTVTDVDEVNNEVNTNTNVTVDSDDDDDDDDEKVLIKETESKVELDDEKETVVKEVAAEIQSTNIETPVKKKVVARRKKTTE
jgi:hypothetical protein